MALPCVYRLTPDLVHKLEIMRLRLGYASRHLVLDLLINSAFENCLVLDEEPVIPLEGGDEE